MMKVIIRDELFQALIDQIAFFKDAVGTSSHLMQEVTQFETKLFEITDKATASSAAITAFEDEWDFENAELVEALEIGNKNMILYYSLIQEMGAFGIRLIDEYPNEDR